ncbi:MAG: CoA transferase [Actinomycetales bacterium]|nr:CoA transferase [Actinomycetales bacterium]
MTLPLSGVLVADFSRVLAGPYATMLLADLGATVVKVERPSSGDDTRAWLPPVDADGQSTYFDSVNRSKWSIDLDIADATDLAIAQRLAQRADVMVENFKVGALGTYGLAYGDVRAANPGIVYCSISGFGSGAGAELPGYDILVQAMGGLMSITGTSEPTKAGVAVVDVLTGLHATVAILAALRHRDVTGIGQHLEVSLLSTLLSSLVNQASAYAIAGVVPTRMGNAHPSIAPYEVYPTADRPIVIAVGNDAQFARMAQAIGAGHMATDERFATNALRVAHREALKAELIGLLAQRGADHWQEVIGAVGVPCGPVNDIADAFALAARLGLDPIVEVNDARRSGPRQQVANPVRYSQTPIRYPSAPPRVGEDRAHVLALLGLGPEPR